MKLATLIVLTIVVFLVLLGLYPAEGLKCFGCDEYLSKSSLFECGPFKSQIGGLLRENDTKISGFIVEGNCSGVCVKGNGTNDSGSLKEIYGCVTAEGTFVSVGDKTYAANVAHLLGQELDVEYHIGDFYLTPCAHDFCNRPFDCSAPANCTLDGIVLANKTEKDCPIPQEYCQNATVSVINPVVSVSGQSPRSTPSPTGLSICILLYLLYLLF